MSTLTILLGLGGVTAAALAVLGSRWWAKRQARITAWSFALFLGLASAAAFGATGYSWWYHHRDQPEPIVEELFPGIEHRRIVRSSPRPLVIDVVTVPLSDPRIELLVTPPTPTGAREQKARTTTEFAAEHGVQLAINANYFVPWDPGYFNHAPARGDGVDVLGWAVSGGVHYGRAKTDFSTLSFTREKQARLGPPTAETVTAVSGTPVLLRAGEAFSSPSDKLAPRTAIGVTAHSRELVLVTVDGRQPGYSEGLTLAELAELLRELGCHDALNLDGGGSTTMVARVGHGESRVLNTPIHRRVPPGQERPVANHLGIFVRSSIASTSPR